MELAERETGRDSATRITRINTIRSNAADYPPEQQMAAGSLETKVNWVKDVDKFESRLTTGKYHTIEQYQPSDYLAASKQVDV